jgi:NADH:ubiquinone oxidoreductase subunit B-like Fe-S oxidoreductase
MLRLFAKTLKTGIVTEKIKRPDASELDALGIEVKRQVDKYFSGSIAIRAVDAGSCNGCELEIHALNNPIYDVERYGIHFVASPRHADVLLVTGPVARHICLM